MTTQTATLRSRRSEVRFLPSALPERAGLSLESRPAKPSPSAHTSPTRPEEAAATSLLQQAIDAYACARHLALIHARTGVDTLTAITVQRACGQHAIGEAWRLVEPDVRSTVAGRIRQPDRQDDATQLAFEKLWQAVRNYNPDRGPVGSAAAFAKWAASMTALNVVESRDRVASGEQAVQLDADETRDAVEYRAAQNTVNTGEEDRAVADYARLVASRAGRNPDRQKLWAAIVLAAGEGHIAREPMAEFVSASTGLTLTATRIRQEVHAMIRTVPHPRDGIGKLERIRDWRTSEAADTDIDLALFAYEWQEIA